MTSPPFPEDPTSPCMDDLAEVSFWEDANSFLSPRGRSEGCLGGPRPACPGNLVPIWWAPHGCPAHRQHLCRVGASAGPGLSAPS